MVVKRRSGEPGTSRPAASASGPFFSTWYGKAWLVAVPLVLGGLAAYLSRGPIVDLYVKVHDAVIGTLGLGLAPVVLWLAVFVWAMTKRRSAFHRPRLWLGSAGLVILCLGAMSFFQPAEGALVAFTLDGDVSLGGGVGEAIAGPVTWLGVFRLLGIFVVTVAVVSPAFAADVGTMLMRAGYQAYVTLAVGVAAMVRMYRIERPPAAVAAGGTVLSPGITPSPAPWEESDVEGGVEGSLPRVDAPQPAAKVYSNGDDTSDSEDHEPSQADDEDGQAGGKLSRLWGSDREGNGAGGGLQGQTWDLPSIELLHEGVDGGISEAEMRETAEIIRRTLAEYGVEVEVGQIRPGPAVTMYGLVPGWVRRYRQVKKQDEHGRPLLDDSGKPIVTREESKTRIKVDNILSREKDLALALKTPSIRIETPAMGKSLVGIEVPNPSPSLVTLRSAMESQEFVRLRTRADLPVALGKASGGETVVIDLAKMPHLLIAGATGAGKSVCLNAIISCLILERSPAEMRLLLIDPKRVELTPYNGIPHLLTPVVVETDKVVGLLKGLIREMLDRYRRMEEVGVRNIESYNRKMDDKMPLLVVAIDELADLMMSAAFDVEQCLCRLAQLGRATGIHLIIATQRPSVDVVTGLIKANFPSRISFGVTSQIDSRTILDTMGAEKLLGRGDMLYLPLEASRPARVQGVFISDREIEGVVNFWQTAPRLPVPRVYLRSVDTRGPDEAEKEPDCEPSDDLLEKAIAMAQTHNKLSTSLLQRRLRIGYPRAARLMDQLEEKGIVGPSDGSKSRDVIMNQR